MGFDIMANGFRVNEKTRTVKVYRLSLNEKDYKIIERYKALDYDVIMLERKEPAKRAGIKAEDLKKYLNNGTIPEAIYKEMKERLDKKQNFLRVKSWLITALKDYADKNNTEYEPLADIIKKAMEQENLENSREEERKGNKDKSKVIEIKGEANKK